MPSPCLVLLVWQILMNVQLPPRSVMLMLYAIILLDHTTAVAKQDSLVTEKRAQMQVKRKEDYSRAVFTELPKKYLLNWPLPIGAFQGQWNTINETTEHNNNKLTVKLNKSLVSFAFLACLLSNKSGAKFSANQRRSETNRMRLYALSPAGMYLRCRNWVGGLYRIICLAPAERKSAPRNSIFKNKANFSIKTVTIYALRWINTNSHNHKHTLTTVRTDQSRFTKAFCWKWNYGRPKLGWSALKLESRRMRRLATHMR